MSTPKQTLWKDKWSRAQAAINRNDTIIYDVAANCGQIVDNVRHMRWFLDAVADEMEQE